jgi:hypothetical protein
MQADLLLVESYIPTWKLQSVCFRTTVACAAFSHCSDGFRLLLTYKATFLPVLSCLQYLAVHCVSIAGVVCSEVHYFAFVTLKLITHLSAQFIRFSIVLLFFVVFYSLYDFHSICVISTCLVSLAC